MRPPLRSSISDLDDFFNPRRSRELKRTPSDHTKEAASLVAQYLSQSPRNESDLATGYGALRRGQKTQEKADMQSIFSRFASVAAPVQQPLLDADEFVPLTRAASTPDEAATRIQQFYRKHRVDLSLRKRSFSKFGQEAFDLIKRYVDTGECGTNLYEVNIAVKARLILHFDINKTILMSDKAQGASTNHMVNVLLCECAWGRLEPGPKWVPVGRLATDRPTNDPQLMSYRSFLDSFLLPSQVGTRAEIEVRNTEVKNTRQALKRKFTEPGQPGEMFRGIFQQLKNTLTLPEECKKAAQESKVGYLFAHGERHILPSFFSLLIHLQKQKRDFTLVFRTFGQDIMEVVDELNMFATGQHPAYPEVRMDGSDGQTDLRMSIPENSACFVRTTAKPDGSLLLLGADKALLTEKTTSKEQLEAAAESSGGLLLRDFKAMHAAIMQKAQTGNRAFAIRDFYSFWKSRNERSRAGKLLLVDPSDEDTVQIFFDDNIGHGSANIVDARNARSGEPLAFQDVNGKNLLKVEPLNAILDPQYFVRAVHQCILAVLHAREADAYQNASENAGFGRPPQGSSPIAGGGHEAFRQRAPPALHSRRGRDLWSIVHRRLTAVVRLRAAMRNS